MRIDRWSGVIAALAGVAALAGSPAVAQCTLTGGVDGVEVALISQPFPYADYEPQPNPVGLPALPDPDDEIVRREHAYVSTAIAAQIGISPHDAAGDRTVNPNWRRPNPQIRVIITTPATFSNFHRRRNGVNEFRNRRSSAVFTVVGVIDDTRERIWVYEQEATADNDSGEYKLFAADGATSTGTRIVRVQNLTDGNADGALDNVVARIYAVPVSSSVDTDTVPNPDVPTTATPFCEPDANGSLTESSIRTGDAEIALLIPHGGDIETGTSDQVAPFVNTLQAEHSIAANIWDVQGVWSDNQTSKRWHITSTNTDVESWPALEAMLAHDDFSAAGEFQHAVSFHGFTGTNLDVIVGGDAERPVKCLIVQRIQEEVESLAAYDGDEIAFVIHDQAAGLIDVEDGNGRTVTRRDLEGTADENIVNRLSAAGGVQIEQSKALRDNAELRTAVAEGAARALGQVVTTTGGAPDDACAQFLPPAP